MTVLFRTDFSPKNRQSYSGPILSIGIKLKCFYPIHVYQLILSHPSFEQCRLLPLPARNTERTPSVLGMNTRKSPHPTFIPSNITTLPAKNTSNTVKTTLWSFVKMSPRSRVGIGARVGLLRTALTTMDTWISAPERNTRFKEKTRSSRKLESK